MTMVVRVVMKVVVRVVVKVVMMVVVKVVIVAVGMIDFKLFWGFCLQTDILTEQAENGLQSRSSENGCVVALWIAIAVILNWR